MAYRNLSQNTFDSEAVGRLSSVINLLNTNNEWLERLSDTNPTENNRQQQNSKIILKNGVKKLNIPTYEGSGHACHPSVVYTPYGFNGYNYWMAFTPYPNGDDQHENPSIVASDDGVEWIVPAGLTNPLATAPSGGYNSDTALLHNLQTGQLVCYYRPVIGGQSVIVRKTSEDGINWTSEETCAGTENVLSPQIVMVNSNEYLMVGQKNGDFIALTSDDGVNFTEKEKARMNIPGLLWHIGMCETHAGYLFTLNTMTETGSNGNTRLYFGSSRNGLSPTYIHDVPILDPKDFYDLQVYQSVLVESDTGMRLYVSGQESGGAWTMGYADVELAGPLFAETGIVNQEIINVNLDSGENTNVVHFEKTYGAKEVRVLVKNNSRHDFEVKIWQDSSGLLVQPLSSISDISIGGVYKSDLYAKRFSLNITNKDVVPNDYTVVITLIK